MSPAASQGHLSVPQSTEAPDPSERLTNIFSVLEVENPVDIIKGDNQAPRQMKTQMAPPKHHYEAETLTNKTEARLALLLLVDDLAAIQEVIDQTWVGYRDGVYDIICASSTTNIAVELVRPLEQVQQPTFTAHGGV